MTNQTKDRPALRAGLLTFPRAKVRVAERTPALYRTAPKGRRAVVPMWTSFDGKKVSNPRLEGLPASTRLLWMLAMIYTGDHDSEGHVPYRAVRKLDVPHPYREMERLIERGMVSRTPTGFYLETWADHCLNQERVAAIKAGNRARAARARDKAAAAEAEAEAAAATADADVLTSQRWGTR